MIPIPVRTKPAVWIKVMLTGAHVRTVTMDTTVSIKITVSPVTIVAVEVHAWTGTIVTVAVVRQL